MTDSSQTPPQYDCIRLDQDEGVVVVRFVDERIADPARIERLGQELLRLSEAKQPQVVIDFTNVKFFSSLAINKLLMLEKRIRAQGGSLRLAEMEPEVHDVFGFTHLDEWFAIRQARDEAVRELRSPSS